MFINTLMSSLKTIIQKEIKISKAD